MTRVAAPAPAGAPDAHVPDPYREHRLIRGQFYSTLPRELLEDVVVAVGVDRFDPELLAMDRSLSAESGDHSAVVGFRNGFAVTYGQLGQARSVLSLLDEGIAAFGPPPGWPAMTSWHRAALAVADDRITRLRQTARAYAGWLCLDRQFIAEHDAFLATWGDKAREFGLDAPTPAPPPKDRPDAVPAPFREYTAARDRFLLRWQLAGLAGPYLPVPPMPHLPLAGGAAVLPNPALGTTFFLPTIFPLPDRQELKQRIDEALDRQRLSAHLGGWSELIATDMAHRGKVMPRLARVFVLQHYWRVLFARHAAALHRQLGRLHEAFAGFLGTALGGSSIEARVIKDDLVELGRARGGPNWHLTPTPLERLTERDP
ncbi:MAG TPA: hypothetical protein VGI81_07030 [Tepidisphaeraceae bacterium]